MGPTDSVAILYGTLQLDPETSGLRGDTLASFEVVEFEGPTWMALVGKDGKPTRQLRFEEARHHAKLYAMSTGRVFWVSPVVTPFPYQEGAVTFLSDSGRIFLQQIGVPIPEKREE